MAEQEFKPVSWCQSQQFNNETISCLPAFLSTPLARWLLLGLPPFTKKFHLPSSFMASNLSMYFCTRRKSEWQGLEGYDHGHFAGFGECVTCHNIFFEAESWDGSCVSLVTSIFLYFHMQMDYTHLGGFISIF